MSNITADRSRSHQCDLIGWDTTRSKQSPFPYSRNVTVDLIAVAGDKLWKELVGTDANRASPMKITSVQLSFSGIATMETGQRSIEGFFKERESPRKQVQVSAPDFEQRPAVKRKRSSDGSSLASRSKVEPRKDDSDDDVLPIANATDDHSVAEMTSWFHCARCGKRVALPEALTDAGLTDDSEITRDTLARLKIEHDDFHFAQDLARQQDADNDGQTRAPGVPRSQSKATKKKRKKEPEGIERFFRKKA